MSAQNTKHVVALYLQRKALPQPVSGLRPSVSSRGDPNLMTHHFHTATLSPYIRRLPAIGPKTTPRQKSACLSIVRAALMAQSVERRTLTRGAWVKFPAVAVGVVVLSKLLMHRCFGSLSRWIMNE